MRYKVSSKAPGQDGWSGSAMGLEYEAFETAREAAERFARCGKPGTVARVTQADDGAAVYTTAMITTTAATVRDIINGSLAAYRALDELEREAVDECADDIEATNAAGYFDLTPAQAVQELGLDLAADYGPRDDESTSGSEYPGDAQDDGVPTAIADRDEGFDVDEAERDRAAAGARLERGDEVQPRQATAVGREPYPTLTLRRKQDQGRCTHCRGPIEPGTLHAEQTGLDLCERCVRPARAT